MRAVDLVETTSPARRDEALLPALRTVVRDGTSCLGVSGEAGQAVGCLSAVDLIELLLPSYLRHQPNLARAIDEEHADRTGGPFVDTPIGDVLGETQSRVPVVCPQATVVELAGVMARCRCPQALVQGAGGTTRGVVTADGLIGALTGAVEDGPE